MSTSIRLNLSSLRDEPKDSIYQLVHVGPFRKNSNDTSRTSVKVHFQKRKGDKLQHWTTVEEWVNVNEAMYLQVGSLWSKTGEMLSSNIYTDKLIFDIPQNGFLPSCLGEILPKWKFIKNLYEGSFWEVGAEAICLKLFADRKTIIIPFFELMRSTYYQSPAVISFLFNPTDPANNAIKTCSVRDRPTQANNYTVSLNANSFNIDKAGLNIFTEMNLNPSFKYSAINAHNDLIVSLTGSSQTRTGLQESYIRGRYNPGKKVTCHSRGIKLTENLFFVTSITNIENLTSFKSILVSDLIQTDSVHESEHKPMPGYLRTVGQYNNQKPPVIDSNEGIDPSMVNAGLLIDFPISFELADIVRDNNISYQTQDKKYSNVHFPKPIDTFSTIDRGAGRNAGQFSTRIADTAEQHKQFLEFAKQFGSIRDVQVKILTINNSMGYAGKDISIFPSWNKDAAFYEYEGKPRKMGILEIVYNTRVYYLVRIYNSGLRSGFFYKSNHASFSITEFNEFIFKPIAKLDGNWSRLKKLYSENDSTHQTQQRLKQIGISLVIEAKNEANVDIVRDCFTSIKNGNGF